MRRLRSLYLLGASAALIMGVPLCAADFKPIFNGADLTGWDGDPRFWSVKDGVIRGETSLKALAFGNTFLIWRDGKLEDFALRLEFRIQSGNSGVQFRSKDLGKWVVSGYQAEVENKQGKVGFLYEEKGRGYLANVGEMVEMTATGERKVRGALATQGELIKRGYYKEKQWNSYLIVAQGNHIEQHLNGFKTIDLIDNDEKRRALEGILALQIHAGPPMVVEFRDILLKSL
jgi:hypothetical protein